jgi:hypothetical protein
MRAYRKPAGVYIELADSVPVQKELVQVAPRPSTNHVFSDTWATAPKDPAICWRLKTAEELSSEGDSEALAELNSTRILKLLIQVNFNQENRIRMVEGKPTITMTQYRDDLVTRFKLLK